MIPSNKLVFNGIEKELPEALLQLGCIGTNYISDGEPHFKSRKRRQKVRTIVLHETGGNYAAQTKNTLIQKKLGAQLIFSEEGIISNHADLVTEQVSHAGRANPFSIGIEVCNPYNPLLDKAPYEPTIPKQWWTWVPNINSPGIKNRLLRRRLSTVPQEYCLPREIQLKGLRILVPWLCKELNIKYIFPSINRGPKRLQRLDKSGHRTGTKKLVGANLEEGIYPHSAFSSHADGQFLLEDLWSAP